MIADRKLYFHIPTQLNVILWYWVEKLYSDQTLVNIRKISNFYAAIQNYTINLHFH